MLVRCMLALVMALTAIGAVAQDDDDDPRYRRNVAPAANSFMLNKEGRPDRLEFDFGRARGTAWLAQQGDLRVETWVQHRGLLCATYEVGIRFGHGESGCTNVEWLAPTHWLTSKRQCNNALMQHVGSDIDPHMATLFDRVTCAERMVRCSGRCN